MTLIVRCADGQTIEYENADRSRLIIEWVDNLQRKTAIYGISDFFTVSVKGKEPDEIEQRIGCVIELIDRVLEVSKRQPEKTTTEGDEG